MSHSFSENISKFGFSATKSVENVASISSKENFLKVFSKALGVSKDEILACFENPCLKKLKDELLFREFSFQKEWIETYADEKNLFSFFPVISSCSTLVHSFNYDIIILCDILNMSIFHKSCSLIRIYSEKNNGNFIVVGLDEGNKLHNLTFNKDQDELGYVFQGIPEQAFINIDDIISEKLKSNLKMNSHLYQTHEQNQNDDDKDYEYILVSIKSFLKEHLQNTPRGLKINGNSYTNNYKIDFYGSDVRHENEIVLPFVRTYDIDGFFGIFTGQQLNNCLKGGGQIVSFVDLSKRKKEMASLKKLIEDTGFQHLTKKKMMKFAEFEATSTFELYAVIASDNVCQGFDNFNLKCSIECAHLFANSFPCMASGCVNSREHRSTKNGRPDYHTQIKTYSFKWDYEAKSFKCLIFHMINSINMAVASVEGLNIFYYVRSIGSKFKTIFTSHSDLLETLSTFLSPFHLDRLLSIDHPKCFIDMAWNFFPDDISGQRTVIYAHKECKQCLFKLFSLACSGMGINFQENFMVDLFVVILCCLRLIVQMFTQMFHTEGLRRSISITEILINCKLISPKNQLSF